MKVAVLGSGVIGVTSAYYLAKAGHDVIIVDRQKGPGLETSFANASLVSPGFASPWAGPGIPRNALKWLFMKHAPLILRPTIDRAMLSWIWAMLSNCTEERYMVNRSRMLRLANFSRSRLIELRNDTGIQYDQLMRGSLQVFRTQKQLDGIAMDMEVLKACDVPFEVLDRAGCVAAEPGLNRSQEKIVGGLWLPTDETGDCFKFTGALADIAARDGVVFHYETSVEELLLSAGRISAVRTSNGDITADAYLLALGSYSTRLAEPLGLRLPVYPVKGYSITVPVLESDRAPVSSVMDETFKIAITRLGDKIRAGGMAELSGFSTNLPSARRATLEHSVTSLFPAACNIAAASFWCGLRPMTPDGTPIIGATHIDNFFINTGHGTLGWTMACGSGHLIAEVISGRKTAIDASNLSIDRYMH